MGQLFLRVDSGEELLLVVLRVASELIAFGILRDVDALIIPIASPPRESVVRGIYVRVADRLCTTAQRCRVFRETVALGVLINFSK